MGNHDTNTARRRDGVHGARADDGPSSGVRLVRRSPDWNDVPVEPPPACSECGSADARRLPPVTGPAYCRGCVDERLCDEVDRLYLDLGGEA